MPWQNLGETLAAVNVEFLVIGTMTTGDLPLDVVHLVGCSKC